MPRSRLILCALTFAAGCGFEPAGSLAADYFLESIASDPLPAVYIANQNVTIQILESRLEFESETRGTQHERIRISSTDPAGTVSDSDTRFSYRQVGDRVEITFDCEDTDSCIAGPHLVGRVSDDKLEIDQAMGRTPLLYRPTSGTLY